mmetsp:Transcript_123652/g.357703  ORF Transcript_123652/g.357703 Transcript_123652/m.357703 type:complete len:259 (-) Transcript_123652:424-1200(-)
MPRGHGHGDRVRQELQTVRPGAHYGVRGDLQLRSADGPHRVQGLVQGGLARGHRTPSRQSPELRHLRGQQRLLGCADPRLCRPGLLRHLPGCLRSGRAVARLSEQGGRSLPRRGAMVHRQLAEVGRVAAVDDEAMLTGLLLHVPAPTLELQEGDGGRCVVVLVVHGLELRPQLSGALRGGALGTTLHALAVPRGPAARDGVLGRPRDCPLRRPRPCPPRGRGAAHCHGRRGVRPRACGGAGVRARGGRAAVGDGRVLL